MELWGGRSATRLIFQRAIPLRHIFYGFPRGSRCMMISEEQQFYALHTVYMLSGRGNPRTLFSLPNLSVDGHV